MPKFSVIIPTFNRCGYTVQAVQSVMEQTCRAHEIIVVVDGSSDETAETVRATYPEVIVYEQPNLGRAVASNTGVAIATGDWVCFLDDDDLWHRQKLEVTAQYIAEHPDCEAINNPVWFFSDTESGPSNGFGFPRDFVAKTLDECHRAVTAQESNSYLPEYLQIEGNSFRLLLERNRGVMSASIIKRTTIIRAGCFCPMQSNTDDWTMFVNVARLCEWHTIPRRLGFTRLHESQSLANIHGALSNLVAQVNAWYTGRPLRERTRGFEMLEPLQNYGPIYRSTVQGYFWQALKFREFRLAGSIRTMGRFLLPRTRDWLYIHIPPPVTWRWERYILGKHK